MKKTIQITTLSAVLLALPFPVLAADTTLTFDNLCDVLELTNGGNSTVYGRQTATSGECAAPERDYLVSGRFGNGGGVIYTGVNGSSSAFTTLILNTNQTVTAYTQTGSGAPQLDARWNGRTWRIGAATNGSTVTGEQKCSVGTSSGGEGTNIQNYEMGMTCGAFDLTYNMYGIPDSLDVTYEGKTLFTTNGYVTNGTTTSVKYCGASTKVNVKVVGSQAGTAWTYSVSCPK